MPNSDFPAGETRVSVAMSPLQSEMMNDYLKGHHPLSPAINMGIGHPRKKERKNAFDGVPKPNS